MGFPNNTFFNLFGAGPVVVINGKPAFIPALKAGIFEFFEEIDFVKEYREKWIKQLIGNF